MEAKSGEMLDRCKEKIREMARFGTVDQADRIIYPLNELLVQLKSLKLTDEKYRLIATYGLLDRHLSGWETEAGPELFLKIQEFIASHETKEEENYLNVKLRPEYGNKNTRDYLFIRPDGGTVAGNGVRKNKGDEYSFDTLPRDTLVVEVGVDHWTNKTDNPDCSVGIAILNLPEGKMSKEQWLVLKESLLNIMKNTSSSERNWTWLVEAFGGEEQLVLVVNILANKTREWLAGPKRAEAGGEEKLAKYGCAGCVLKAVGGAPGGAPTIEMSLYDVGQYMNNPTKSSLKKFDLGE